MNSSSDRSVGVCMLALSRRRRRSRRSAPQTRHASDRRPRSERRGHSRRASVQSRAPEDRDGGRRVGDGGHVGRQGVATARTCRRAATRSRELPRVRDRDVTRVRVRAGENRREVTLAMQKVDETVAVGRDPATSRVGSQQRSVQQRPDQANRSKRCRTIPTKWRGCSRRWPGPAATIRVDGFRGGRLPPKSQIRSIRFTQRHVRGREPWRRHDVRRHHDRSPASGRCAAASTSRSATTR